MQKTYVFFIVFVVGLIILGGFVYTKYTSKPVYTSVLNTPTKVLKQKNIDFNTASTFSRQGEYDKALISYKKALSSAEDLVQEAQIKYYIASTYESLRNYEEAIKEFKDIAANTKYYTFVRAYAVQEIAYMYKKMNNPKEVNPIIVSETFKDAPYNAFLTGNDYELANRKLFEYAATIYPLVTSEVFIASWYAHDLRFVQNGATTTKEGVADILAALDSLQKANKDIVRTKDDPVASQYLADAFVHMGVTQADLALAKVIGPVVPEESFKKGINLIATGGFKPGNFAPYNYASYLANQYGATRKDDISSILSVFSATNSKNIYPSIEHMFRDARTDPIFKQQKSDIRLLGSLDASFKTYLISLGWYASDFTTN